MSPSRMITSSGSLKSSFSSGFGAFSSYGTISPSLISFCISPFSKSSIFSSGFGIYSSSCLSSGLRSFLMSS